MLIIAITIKIVNFIHGLQAWRCLKMVLHKRYGLRFFSLSLLDLTENSSKIYFLIDSEALSATAVFVLKWRDTYRLQNRMLI